MVHEICENPDSQKIARIFFRAFLESKANFHFSTCQGSCGMTDVQHHL
jgi:hypothetical protein